jgi:PAS domain-containing protein
VRKPKGIHDICSGWVVRKGGRVVRIDNLSPVSTERQPKIAGQDQPSAIKDSVYESFKDKEGDSLYRSLFNENSSVMLVIDPESGDILDANVAAAGFYGYSLEQLIAMKIFEINCSHSPSELSAEMQKAGAQEKNRFFFSASTGRWQ